jgi:HEAT repeat protein
MTAVEVKREKVVERLRTAIEDEDVRREAFLALASVISSEGNDVFLRCRAAHALSVFPRDMAVSVLVGLTRSEESALRFYGSRSLAYLCEQGGFETLKTFLSHPSPAVRQLAETALSDARAHCGGE